MRNVFSEFCRLTFHKTIIFPCTEFYTVKLLCTRFVQHLRKLVRGISRRKVICCSYIKAEQFTVIDEITCRTTHLMNWEGRTDRVEESGCRIMNHH